MSVVGVEYPSTMREMRVLVSFVLKGTTRNVLSDPLPVQIIPTMPHGRVALKPCLLAILSSHPDITHDCVVHIASASVTLGLGLLSRLLRTDARDPDALCISGQVAQCHLTARGVLLHVQIALFPVEPAVLLPERAIQLKHATTPSVMSVAPKRAPSTSANTSRASANTSKASANMSKASANTSMASANTSRASANKSMSAAEEPEYALLEHIPAPMRRGAHLKYPRSPPPAPSRSPPPKPSRSPPPKTPQRAITVSPSPSEIAPEDLICGAVVDES